MHRFATLLLVPVALLGLSLPAAADVEPGDEAFLKEHRVPTDGPALLEFVRKHLTEEVSEQRLKELIEQLGDDSFAKREEASIQLVLLGRRSRNHLLAALRNPDLETRTRAKRCLQEIDRPGGLALEVPSTAIRVLAQRRPAGTVKMLFTLLPDVAELALAGEIREALVTLAVKDGRLNPVLVEGLKDRLAVKRAAAAFALCRAKASDQLSVIRKLLDDPDTRVRTSVALALLQMRHKKGMPALLALLDQPPTREAGLVEEMLFRLAGDKAPALPDGSERSRKKYRANWEAWWKEYGSKLDPAVIEERARAFGHTTVLLLDEGEVLDLDASNRVCWKFDKLEQPLDVQRLGNDRVLLAEHGGNRVTERNSKGEIVWEKKINEPLSAERLPNGNTFIANRYSLVEVDRTGKEVFTYSRPAGEDIMRARRLPDGDILLITQRGVTRFVRLNRLGKEIKSFGVDVATSGGRLDLTRAGNVLIPELQNQRVVERDMDGKMVREFAVLDPITALALPNGHVIATSMSQKRAIEFDRAGREVWDYKRDTRVTRAVRH
jgi:hypothetical protein